MSRHIHVVALTAFDYAHDGVKIESVPENAVLPVRSELVDGLTKSGTVRAATDEEAETGVAKAKASKAVKTDAPAAPPQAATSVPVTTTVNTAAAAPTSPAAPAKRKAAAKSARKAAAKTGATA